MRPLTLFIALLGLPAMACDNILEITRPSSATSLSIFEFDTDLPQKGSSLDLIANKIRFLRNDLPANEIADWIAVSLHSPRPVPIEFMTMALSDQTVQKIRPYPRLKRTINIESALSREVRLKLIEIHLQGQHNFTQASMISIFHNYLQLLNGSKKDSRPPLDPVAALLAMDLIFAQGYPRETVLPEGSHHTLAGLFLGLGMTPLSASIYSALATEARHHREPGQLPTLPSISAYRELKYQIEKRLIYLTGGSRELSDNRIISHREILERLYLLKNGFSSDDASQVARYETYRMGLFDIFQKELGITIKPRVGALDFGL